MEKNEKGLHPSASTPQDFSIAFLRNSDTSKRADSVRPPLHGRSIVPAASLTNPSTAVPIMAPPYQTCLVFGVNSIPNVHTSHLLPSISHHGPPTNPSTALRSSPHNSLTAIKPSPAVSIPANQTRNPLSVHASSPPRHSCMALPPAPMTDGRSGVDHAVKPGGDNSFRPGVLIQHPLAGGTSTAASASPPVGVLLTGTTSTPTTVRTLTAPTPVISRGGSSAAVMPQNTGTSPSSMAQVHGALRCLPVLTQGKPFSPQPVIIPSGAHPILGGKPDPSTQQVVPLLGTSIAFTPAMLGQAVSSVGGKGSGITDIKSGALSQLHQLTFSPGLYLPDHHPVAGHAGASPASHLSTPSLHRTPITTATAAAGPGSGSSSSAVVGTSMLPAHMAVVGLRSAVSVAAHSPTPASSLSCTGERSSRINTPEPLSSGLNHNGIGPSWTTSSSAVLLSSAPTMSSISPRPAILTRKRPQENDAASATCHGLAAIPKSPQHQTICRSSELPAGSDGHLLNSSMDASPRKRPRKQNIVMIDLHVGGSLLDTSSTNTVKSRRSLAMSESVDVPNSRNTNGSSSKNKSRDVHGDDGGGPLTEDELHHYVHLRRKPKYGIMLDGRHRPRIPHNHFQYVGDAAVKAERRTGFLDLVQLPLNQVLELWKIQEAIQNLDSTANLEKLTNQRIQRIRELVSARFPQDSGSYGELGNLICFCHELIQGSSQRCQIGAGQTNDIKLNLRQIVERRQKVVDVYQKLQGRKVSRRKFV